MQTLSNREPITAWKMAVVAICVCVFLFTLQAKVMAYDSPSPGVTAVVDSTLWTDGQKMELQAGLGFLFIALLVAVLVWAPHVARAEQLLAETAEPFPQVIALGLHRYLRPPPPFSHN